MAAETNLTKSANIQTTPRAVDFVSRFADYYQGLLELMGVTRNIEKRPGEVLTVKTADVTLQSGAVAEGDEVPLSIANVTETPVGTMTIMKYRKAVSAEAILAHGYADAVSRTDTATIRKIIGLIKAQYVAFIQTGSLTDTATDFQKALAKARFSVLNAFKAMDLEVTEVVAYVNMMDFADYLGTAEISTQMEFGMTYIENFMGYRRVFLMSNAEIPRGKVIAVPVDNIVSYRLNPANADFRMAGLEYYTDGITNLIGVYTDPNYKRVQSEMNVIYGLYLFAEYLNGIAVVTISASNTTSGNTSNTPGA